MKALLHLHPKEPYRYRVRKGSGARSDLQLDIVYTKALDIVYTKSPIDIVYTKAVMPEVVPEAPLRLVIYN